MAAEAPRGCGYRKIGGTYLTGGGAGIACGRFPIPLVPCPTCAHRPAFTRGLQRLTAQTILHAAPVCRAGAMHCFQCPFGAIDARATAGLMWVGDRYYTPATFAEEAVTRGVSKRIALPIPRWLKLGRTWVFIAHPKTISRPCDGPCAGAGAVTESLPPAVPAGELFPVPTTLSTPCRTCAGTGKLFTPAVFFAFRPDRIERIIPDTMPDAEREALRARGLSLVEVPADDPDHQPTRRDQP